METTTVTEANLATMGKWVSEASGGTFTVEQQLHRMGTSFGSDILYVSIVRRDGRTVYSKDTESDIRGVGVDVEYSFTWKKLDRRNKRQMKRVFEGLIKAEQLLLNVPELSDDELVDAVADHVHTRYGWARWNSVKY